MANDLPETGMRAVLEGWQDYEKGARAVAAATEQMEASFADMPPVEVDNSGFEELRASLEEVRAAQREWIQELDAEQAALADTPEDFDRITAALNRIAKASGQDAAQGMMDWANEALAAGTAAADVADKLEELADKAKTSGEDMSSLTSIVQLAGAAFAATRVAQIGQQLVDLSKETVQTAARLEELDLVLGNLAEQNNRSTEEMRAQVEAIRAQGVQADVAYNLVSQFVRGNLDLAKASNLARVAQDAAVISMEDSSQALAGILHGIMTLQPEVLRYRGIIVDLGSEYQRWAEANGRTAQSMTSVEKQQVALDAVLSQGKTIVGTYESAMESASKQLRSFPRYIADLKAEFGQSLLPAYSGAIFATKDLLKAMENLNPAWKAAIAGSGAVAGGLITVSGKTLQFIATIGMALPALKALQAALAQTSFALLGPVGLAVGLAAVATIGVASFVKAQEEAYIQEAAAIAADAKSYDDYVKKVKAAELGSYALTEGLYEVAKGADAAKKGIDALSLTEAFREMDKAIGGAATGIKALDDLFNQMNQAGSEVQLVDYLKAALDELLPTLNAAELAVLQDEEAVRRLGVSSGLTGSMLISYTMTVTRLAERQAFLNQMNQRSYEYDQMRFRGYESQIQTLGAYEQQLIELSQATIKAAADAAAADSAFSDFGAGLAGYVTPEVQKLVEELTKLAAVAGGIGPALEATESMWIEAVKGAESQITEIRAAAAAEQTEILNAHREDEVQAWADYRDRITDIESQRGEIHARLLQDMAEAERRYQADRLAVQRDTVKALADAEANYAEARANLNKSLLSDLAQMEADAGKNRTRLQDQLAKDMQTIEATHQQRLLDLQEQRIEAAKQLEESYQQALLSIQQKYDQQRRAIEEKYRLVPNRQEEIDAERQYLLQALQYFEDLQRGGMTNIDYTQQISDIKAGLDALKDEELAALQETQDAEIAQLKAQLEEKQKALDAAYAVTLAAEQAAYEKAKAARQAQYVEDLNELNANLEEQKAKRQAAYEQAVVDLDAKHAVELAKIQKAGKEKLAALETRLAEEKLRLDAAAKEAQSRLTAQEVAEATNYQNRKIALDTAYAKRNQTINEKEQAAVDAVTKKANELADNTIKAWQRINPAVAEQLRILKDNTFTPKMDELIILSYDKGKKAGQEYARGFKDGVGPMHSPPAWAIWVGGQITDGLAEGMDFSNTLKALAGFKQDAASMLEASSPSKWAERLGTSVSQGFADAATLEPQLGNVPTVTAAVEYEQAEMAFGIPDTQRLALESFMSDVPGIAGQDMAIRPYLQDVPAVPDQTMAVQPYLLNMPGLAQVEAPVTPDIAAAGGSTQQIASTRNYNLNYTGEAQSEMGIRSILTLMEMSASA